MAVGMRPPRRGLFGNPMMQPEMPAPTMQPAPQDRLAAVTAPQEPEKPKADWGGRLAALGALLQGNMGGVMAYHQNQRQMAMQAEQEKRAAQMAEAQRMAGLQDYRTKREIDAEFATQTPPAIAQNYEFIRQTAGDEAAKDYVANYGRGPEEPRMIQVGGHTYFGTMSEIRELLQQGASSNAPSAPVGRLTPVGGGGVSNGTGSFQ